MTMIVTVYRVSSHLGGAGVYLFGGLLLKRDLPKSPATGEWAASAPSAGTIATPNRTAFCGTCHQLPNFARLHGFDTKGRRQWGGSSDFCTVSWPISCFSEPFSTRLA